MTSAGLVAHGGAAGLAIELALVLVLTGFVVAVVLNERRRGKDDPEETAE